MAGDYEGLMIGNPGSLDQFDPQRSAERHPGLGPIQCPPNSGSFDQIRLPRFRKEVWLCHVRLLPTVESRFLQS